MAIARLNGEVIAESAEAVVVNGRHYFPAQSVRVDLLRPTSLRENRHYYAVIVDGKPVEDAAAYYLTGPSIPDPRVAEHVEFFVPVTVED
jgi:uncharacterized protein (DUF427 family)